MGSISPSRHVENVRCLLTHVVHVRDSSEETKCRWAKGYYDSGNGLLACDSSFLLEQLSALLRSDPLVLTANHR